MPHFDATRGKRRPSPSSYETDPFEGWVRIANLETTRAREFANKHDQEPTAWARLVQMATISGALEESVTAAVTALDLLVAKGSSPRDFPLIQTCLFALIASDRYVEALRYVSDLPPSPSLALLQASIDADLGNFDSAIDLVSSIDAPGAAALRGHLYFHLGNDNRAVHELRSALRQNPTDPDSLVLIARAFDRMGATTKAKMFALRAARTSPGRKDIGVYLLELYVDHGEFDLAKEQMAQVLQRLNTEPVEFVVLQARIEIETGNLSRGVALLRRAVDLYKAEGDSKSEAWGRAVIAAIRFSDRAISRKELQGTIRKELALAPGDVRLSSMLVNSLILMSDAAEVHEVLGALPPTTSPAAIAPLEMHSAYLDGRYEQAMSIAVQCARMSPLDTYMTSMAGLFVGQLTEDWVQAYEIVRLAINANPNNAVLANDAAYLAALSGQPSTALAILDGIGVTDDYALIATRGLANITIGRVSEGLRLYREAALLADKTSADLHGRALMTIHQAMALRRLRLGEDAMAEVRAAALPTVPLPDDADDSPAFRFLQFVADKKGWDWPVSIE